MTSLLLSLSLSAAAGQRQIAVLDVEARPGVSASVASSLTDALVIEARRAFGSGAVIGTDDVRQLLHFTEEKRKLGCLEVECLAELGGALGVPKLLVATLGRLGEQYLLSVRLVDARRAQVIAQGAATALDDEELLAAARRSVAQVAGALIDAAKPRAVPEVATAAPPAKAAPAPHSHALAYVLGGLAAGALVAGIVGTLQVTSFWSLRGQSASPGASIPISQGESAQASAQWGAPLSVAGYCAAAALAGSAVLTW